MSEKTKFTEEELTKITDLRDQTTRITSELGQVQLQKSLISEELQQLEELSTNILAQFKNLRVEETEFVGKLNEKYGKGTVDITTGEFVPES
jgi:hypothetical protein